MKSSYIVHFFFINKKILLKVKTHYTTLLGGRQNPIKRAEKITFVTVKDPMQRVTKDPTHWAGKIKQEKKKKKQHSLQQKHTNNN